MDGVAVKVTGALGQNGFLEAKMVTPAGKLVFTDRVMAFEVAGLPVTHASVELSTQSTISPLTGAYE